MGAGEQVVEEVEVLPRRRLKAVRLRRPERRRVLLPPVAAAGAVREVEAAEAERADGAGPEVVPRERVLVKRRRHRSLTM